MSRRLPFTQLHQAIAYVQDIHIGNPFQSSDHLGQADQGAEQIVDRALQDVGQGVGEAQGSHPASSPEDRARQLRVVRVEFMRIAQRMLSNAMANALPFACAGPHAALMAAVAACRPGLRYAEIGSERSCLIIR